MIDHQTIRRNTDIEQCRGVNQNIDRQPVVGRGAKRSCPPPLAVHHMMPSIGIIDSQRT